MEPLTGDRPNNAERVPHYFVVITERDDNLVTKIYFSIQNCVPSRPRPPDTEVFPMSNWTEPLTGARYGTKVRARVVKWPPKY